MSEIVLESKALSKQYGDYQAVSNLSLSLRRGEVFGLLGPNGAGKTTTILMLLGLTEPTGGSVSVLGLDPARQPLSVKARVGYLPDQVGFYENMSARENLRYTARLNGIPRAEAQARIEEALARVGLAEVGDKLVKTFSRGMRQRLGVAEVLIKRPEIIIMDEPTLALDPEAAREFLDLIRALKEQGATILLSSHLLYQVQAVCDRVGLFSKGRMVLEGSVEDLARRVLGSGYRVRLEVESAGEAQREAIAAALAALPGVVKVERPGERSFELEASRDLRAEAAEAVVRAGGRLLGLGAELPNLDEIYARYFKTEVADVRAA